ncbi:MAG: polysaccharide deacetylase family protein [Jannaschia sp.]
MAFTLLLYHSVDDSGSFLSVPVARFHAQMRAVRRSGRRVLTVAQAAQAARSGDRLADAACITFDDAYRSVADNAWPILRDLGLGATIYCVSGEMGGRARWLPRVFPTVFDEAAGEEAALREVEAVIGIASIRDPDLAADPVRALRRAASLPIMDWDTARALMAEGMDPGGHTISHPFLTRLDASALTGEVADDRTALADHLGAVPATFAYPFGDLDAATIAAVRMAGYECAVTSAAGAIRDPGADPHRWARIGIWPRVGGVRMRLYLSRLYALARPAE